MSCASCCFWRELQAAGWLPMVVDGVFRCEPEAIRKADLPVCGSFGWKEQVLKAALSGAGAQLRHDCFVFAGLVG